MKIIKECSIALKKIYKKYKGYFFALLILIIVSNIFLTVREIGIIEDQITKAMNEAFMSYDIKKFDAIFDKNATFISNDEKVKYKDARVNIEKAIQPDVRFDEAAFRLGPSYNGIRKVWGFYVVSLYSWYELSSKVNKVEHPNGWCPKVNLDVYLQFDLTGKWHIIKIVSDEEYFKYMFLGKEIKWGP